MITIDASDSPARREDGRSLGVDIGSDPDSSFIVDIFFNDEIVLAETDAGQVTFRGLNTAGLQKVTYFGTFPLVPADERERFQWENAVRTAETTGALVTRVTPKVSADPEIFRVAFDRPDVVGSLSSSPVSNLFVEGVRMIGSAFDDTLGGGQSADTLSGGGGGDSLFGDLGDDILSGQDGDDTLLGDFQDDRLIGGKGDDSLDGGRDDDTLVGGGGNDTLLGGVGSDLLKGGGGDDRLFSGGADSFGAEGVDTLSGGGGNDRMVLLLPSTGGGVTNPGGPGDPRARAAEPLPDTGLPDDDFALRLSATGGGGKDSLRLEASTSYGELFYDFQDGGIEITRSFGTGVLPYARIETGGVERVEAAVTGAAATGGYGFSWSGDEDVTLHFVRKANALVASVGAVIHVLEAAGDGSAVDALLVRSAGGDDRITLKGLEGSRILITDSGAGRDVLKGRNGNEVMTGGDGADKVSGRGGSDLIGGGGGNDRVNGGPGDDILNDGPGRDRLAGGPGADVFGLDADATADLIRDFRPDQGDTLVIEGLVDAADVEARARDGGGVVLTFEGDSVELPGDLRPGDLSPDWFQFEPDLG